jgi:hypothetical protein
MPANSIDRVKQNIRERLEELESERDQLMRALEALTAGGAPLKRRGRPPGSGAGSTSGATRGGGTGRRAARGQRRRQVLEVLQGTELGPSGVAAAIGGINPTQVSSLLRGLADEGLLARTEGGKWRLTGASVSEAPAPAAPSPQDGGGGFSGAGGSGAGGSDSIS